MTVLALSFLLLPFLVASVSGSKCTAMCFLDKRQNLACALKSGLPNPSDFSQPVRCVRKEYGTSIEVVIGASEVVDGLVPGGFDVFSTSEQISSSQMVPIQLTLNVKIKNVGPRVFTKISNLQRLQLHPYDVHACAFYDLPRSVTQVLLQCVGPNMKMLAPMRWPAGSPVSFKMNMCMQENRCYTCPGSRSVELRSTVKGPLSLNKVVSLTECVAASSCQTDNKVCEVVTTTTTTTTTTTPKPAMVTTNAAVKPTKAATKEAAAKPAERKSEPARPTGTGADDRREEHELRMAESRLVRGEKRENFLLLAVAGATVLNSLMLLIVLVVLFYAASCCCCCRKKARGVFFISKENYPPEYSTLRPV